MYRDFTYFAPTRVMFGHATESKVGELCKRAGAEKVLLHYGSERVIENGLMDRVRASLAENGLSYVMLGGVKPNPRISLVRKGVELCVREKVDMIVAVGGGSVIDSSKAIGYGVANGGDVWDFYSRKRVPSACLPIGVVLTLAAAGSEMSNSSVLTDEASNMKHGYSNDISRPLFACLNPELTLTLPDYQTECGCTDIMMHTMERYFTPNGTLAFTDSMAEALLRTVMAQAVILHSEPDNLQARAEVMWAGSISHNGLTSSGSDGGDWVVHQLEHELGAIYDVAHGAGLAAVWGTWARYVYRNCLGRFYRFAVNVMGIEENADQLSVALKGIEAMESFYRAIGMPTSLKELGIQPDDAALRMMAKKCADWNGGKKGTAMVLMEHDFYEIYKRAQQ